MIVGLPVSRVGYLSSHCTVRTVPAATGKFSVELRGSTRFQAGFSPVQGPFSVGHTFLGFSGSKDVSPVHFFLCIEYLVHTCKLEFSYSMFKRWS